MCTGSSTSSAGSTCGRCSRSCSKIDRWAILSLGKGGLVNMDQERQIITFDALEAWSYPVHRTYTYDYISDDSIKAILAQVDALERFQLADSWGELTENYTTGPDNPVHPWVVAKLVSKIGRGAEVTAIQIIAEPDIRERCGFCVTDGHHRLRALQFLGQRYFTARMTGELSDLLPTF